MENRGITLQHSIKIPSSLSLFNDFALCLGGHPISFPRWRDKGINTLSDIIADNALRSFQDLKSHFNLPATSFFFYLQLCSALRAYRVPWGENLEPHPIIKYVVVHLPKAWSPLFTHFYLNMQKNLCKWIVDGAMISQFHPLQSIGPWSGQSLTYHLVIPIIR